MLVGMIHTRLFAMARVKSCPVMHSSWAIAFLWLCSHSWPSFEIKGWPEKEWLKGNYWSLNREHKSWLSIKGRGP